MRRNDGSRAQIGYNGEMTLDRIVLAFVLVCGCGSNAETGDPLISGSVQASYDGHAFTPKFGFATVYKGSGLIGLGDGPIHCGSEKLANPPSGSGVIISIPTLTAGIYSTAFVQVFRNVSGYESVGTTSSVHVTAVTTSVTATVNFTFIDSMARMFTASGTFEVLACAP